MAKIKILLPYLLFLSLFLLSATLAHSYEREDPKKELQRCREQCEESHPDEKPRRRCESWCEEQYQKEKQEEKGAGRQDGSEDPKLWRCKDKCQQHGWPRLSQCERECEEKYGGKGEPSKDPREERPEGWPYIFQRDRFKHPVQTQHGNIWLLEKFYKRSHLLLGIANYRLAILEADPNTIVVPHHFDAEAVYYVARGRGVIGLVCENNQETHDLRQGDILRVQAGTIAYLINKDSNEKLYIVKLIQPVAIPGKFEAFYDVGGEDPESYYLSFSNEVLEAALNVPREKIEKFFGKQKKGAIFRAPEEKIRELSRKSSEGGGGGESQRPFNLLQKTPSHANERGQLYDACDSDYPPLRDLDIAVSYAIISGGSMMAPLFLTHATKVSLVVAGNGSVEIVCPHLSKRERWQEEREGQQEQKGRRGQRLYERVQSRISTGVAIVVPAGHPTVLTASPGENLEVLCFDVKVRNNQRHFLAGRNNIVKKVDKVAREVAFDASSEEVEQVFDAQKGKVFLKGPQEREEGRERDGMLGSILDFAGF